MSQPDKNKNNKFEIHEMFMAEAVDKCFYGIIKRTKNSQGKPHLFSRITINDGIVQACASDQRVLSRMLDEMCVMVLFKGIHEDAGAYIILHGEKYFLN